MFRSQHITITGFQIVDTDDTVDESVRAGVMPPLATIGRETNAGYGNHNILRPGDHGNMMYWPLDPTKPPVRGLAGGSYSYAMPSRKRNDGKFYPLSIPGNLSDQHEALSIEEASPKDWIVLATIKHGDRRKLAFRSGANPLLIADHRSQVAPQLSSIVHDGIGNQHDEIRKAGLHTFWEVRHWAVPGSQGLVPPKYAGVPTTDGYSLAWVGDTSPDNTGYCRVGFGTIDGLFSHLVSGPFVPSLMKHWLADTPDGPMVSGALSTNAYFKGSGNPYSAPLDFEEKPYPNPADSTFEYKVFLYYDANKPHPHILGQKQGMWRWFTRIPIGETPKCTPTKDYSTSDTNGNPRRTFAEDSRAFVQKKAVSTGLYMMPRVNLMRGRIEDPEVEGGVI